MVLFTPKKQSRSTEKQIGGTTADELLFRWGRHDGRRAGDSNFVLLGGACKMASDGRLAANHNGRELMRLGVAAASLCHVFEYADKAIGDDERGILTAQLGSMSCALVVDGQHADSAREFVRGRLFAICNNNLTGTAGAVTACGKGQRYWKHFRGVLA